jgi:hypothetical protein
MLDGFSGAQPACLGRRAQAILPAVTSRWVVEFLDAKSRICALLGIGLDERSKIPAGMLVQEMPAAGGNLGPP